MSVSPAADTRISAHYHSQINPFTGIMPLALSFWKTDEYKPCPHRVATSTAFCSVRFARFKLNRTLAPSLQYPQLNTVRELPIPNYFSRIRNDSIKSFPVAFEINACILNHLIVGSASMLNRDSSELHRTAHYPTQFAYWAFFVQFVQAALFSAPHRQ